MTIHNLMKNAPIVSGMATPFQDGIPICRL